MIDVNQNGSTGGDAGPIEVVFRLPVDCGADSVCVVGEFNGWSEGAHQMTRDGEHFVLTVELDAGRTYRFRYLLDGHRWENDWAAHDYVPNEYGGNDSLVDLTNR